MTKRISHDDYNREFGVGADTRKHEQALANALDIRKFEIQLYWTRAAYFWTFIGAALAAFGAIQTVDDLKAKIDLSVVVACIGFVFSFAWFCVNRGSKQWQENWENHVDLLEDGVIGPLYKIVLRRPPPKSLATRLENVIVGPAPYSVSKINQLVSLYICIVWLLLLFHVLPIQPNADFSGLYLGMIGLSLLVSIMIAMKGRTYGGHYDHQATRRRAAVTPDKEPIKSEIGLAQSNEGEHEA